MAKGWRQHQPNRNRNRNRFSFASSSLFCVVRGQFVVKMSNECWFVFSLLLELLFFLWLALSTLRYIIESFSVFGVWIWHINTIWFFLYSAHEIRTNLREPIKIFVLSCAAARTYTPNIHHFFFALFLFGHCDCDANGALRKSNQRQNNHCYFVY